MEQDTHAAQLFGRRIRVIQRALFYCILLIAVVGFGVSMIRVDETYEAPGRVVPRDVRTIYSPDECFVQESLVREGDRVTSGQLLLALATDDLDAQTLQLRSEAERLQAQIVLEKTRKEQVLRNPVSAEFRHVDVELGTAEERVRYYDEYMAMLEKLADEGIISRLDYGQASLARTQARADLKRGEANRKMLNSGYLDAVLRAADAQVRLLETNLRAVRAGQTLLETHYARRRIHAPAPGLVVASERSDPGEPVRRGEPLFQIALNDDLEVELRGGEVNVNRVHPGQEVRIKSNVFSHYKHGYAKGRVKSIGLWADSPEPSALSPFAVPTYRLVCDVVEIPQGHDLPFGSRVTAQITLRRTNVFMMVSGLGRYDE